MPQKHIVSFGECMLELSGATLGEQNWALNYGGDTYNVALYLARLGCDVSYMTALGQDRYSTTLRNLWQAEGIKTGLVLTHPDRIPGLYSINVDKDGERTFLYWRGQSAARAFFDCPDTDECIQRAQDADVVYLSGITLSLFSQAQREQICNLARVVRAKGGEVVFDTNFRANGWPDRNSAAQAIAEFASHATMLLPTLEDDQALYDVQNYEDCANYWLSRGVREVAVKLGRSGAYVASAHIRELVPTPVAIAACDTTGAGDSFNGAYVAARLSGATQVEAAKSGHRLAGEVVRHRGAIIPKSSMPAHVLATKIKDKIR
jgi:2-dehydro-3-deoxygluconokinase